MIVRLSMCPVVSAGRRPRMLVGQKTSWPRHDVQRSLNALLVGPAERQSTPIRLVEMDDAARRRADQTLGARTLAKRVDACSSRQ